MEWGALRPEQGEGARGDGYDFYPGRQLLKDEFDAIWETRAPHHPEALTPAVHNRLFKIIFHQRPLKPPQAAHDPQPAIPCYLGRASLFCAIKFPVTRI